MVTAAGTACSPPQLCPYPESSAKHSSATLSFSEQRETWFRLNSGFGVFFVFFATEAAEPLCGSGELWVFAKSPRVSLFRFVLVFWCFLCHKGKPQLSTLFSGFSGLS